MIVDAATSTASDTAITMDLGAEGVVGT